MRIKKTLLVALSILALAGVQGREAAASGGCFSREAGQTQVSGHRMILSISDTKTSLWDQIAYTGDPQSFAWVLPIKGKVDVGISSHALFESLNAWTHVTVSSPLIDCAPPPRCEHSEPAYGITLADHESPGDMTVFSHAVVGPYETAQLSSQDPNALKSWLTGHDYIIPDDISPIIDAYVSEGFNFLAIKLVPGQGINAMKPIRVTTPGLNPVVPLRMVAAGAAATTPITLWVVGEGTHVPSNFPRFTLPEDQLVWDWDRKVSNYNSLRQDGFTGSSNKGWLIEATVGLYSSSKVTSPLLALALMHPEESGYGDGMSVGPFEACGADIDALISDISRGVFTITKLQAELSREALATDLIIEAASDPILTSDYLKATRFVGKAPTCPDDPPCAAVQMTDAGPQVTDNEKSAVSGCACATSREADPSTALLGALLSLGWALARRRKLSPL